MPPSLLSPPLLPPQPAGRGWRTRLRPLLAALLLSAAGAGGVQAGPVPWPDAPYSYFANNARLDTVLADFAGSFSLSLTMPPDIGAAAVNGRFTTKNPAEFISRLAGVYGFVWYTHAGTLFISKASEAATRGISAGAGSISGMRKALLDLGVLEPRFGWGELAEQNVALVSGPASYVSLIEATVRNLPAARAQQVAVFRLKHAAAEDRTILFRDREITTPGLTTILRELISGRGAAGVPEALAAAAAPLRAANAVTADATGAMASAATGVVPGARAPNPLPAAGASPAALGPAPRGLTATIQSDPRLNAIIVQDLPERMPIYEQLIAQLDVPTALIEIEAMIIDINTERAKELGINWAGRDGRTAFGFGRLQDPQPGNLTIARGPGAANISASSLAVASGNYLINQLRILETDGDAQIHSRPSVLTTDNTGALLDLSETFYIRVQGERVANVTPVTAGTTLRVTPRVIPDSDHRLVQLRVDIEDGQIQDRQIDALPTVRRSSVSTQAIVQQEDVLLIAGYTSDQSITSDSRIPVLGDIPGLGVLFGTKTRSTQKRERLFLIRPRIVSLPRQNASSLLLPPFSESMDPPFRLDRQLSSVPPAAPAASTSPVR